MMVRTRVSRLGVALLIASSVAFAACSSDDNGDAVSTTTGGSDGGSQGTSDVTSPPDEQPKTGGSFTWLNFPSAPPRWDPAYPGPSAANNSVGLSNYLSAVYGYLLYENWESGEVVPQMAESLEPTDASHWVLKLRPNVKFTDGTPFDAEAVKYNWERIQSRPDAPQRPVASTIASMTVADPLTLEIELVAPNSVFDATVAANLPFIGSPTALKAGDITDNPVGAGPFILESYGSDGTAKMVRNPDYWDAPKPYVDELVIRNIVDNAQRLATILTGDGDLAASFFDEMDQAEAAGFETQTHFAPGGGGTYIFDTQHAPFDDVIARRAVARVVDGAQLNEVLYGSNGVAPLLSPFDEGHRYHNPKAKYLQADAAAAQELFDEYAAKTGAPMDIVYTTVATPGNARTSEVLQAMFAEFDNVKFTVNAVEVNEYGKTLAGGNFGMAQYLGDVSEPLVLWTDLFKTGGKTNFGKYSNAKVDDLLTRAASEIDADARAELIKQVQEILVNDDAIMFNYARQPHGIILGRHTHGIDTYANVGLWLWDSVWLDA